MITRGASVSFSTLIFSQLEVFLRDTETGFSSTNFLSQDVYAGSAIRAVQLRIFVGINLRPKPDQLDSHRDYFVRQQSFRVQAGIV
jgi:hypothetical protein